MKLEGPEVESGPLDYGEEEEVESKLEVKELLVPEQEVGKRKEVVSDNFY